MGGCTQPTHSLEKQLDDAARTSNPDDVTGVAPLRARGLLRLRQKLDRGQLTACAEKYNEGAIGGSVSPSNYNQRVLSAAPASLIFKEEGADQEGNTHFKYHIISVATVQYFITVYFSGVCL